MTFSDLGFGIRGALRGHRRLLGMGALGASVSTDIEELKAKLLGPAPGEASATSTIDWWCWDYPGFKDCHALAFEAAQNECEAGGQPNDPTCLTTHADALAKAKCTCPATPPPAASAPPTGLLIGIFAIGALAIFWPSEAPKGSKS